MKQIELLETVVLSATPVLPHLAGCPDGACNPPSNTTPEVETRTGTLW